MKGVLLMVITQSHRLVLLDQALPHTYPGQALKQIYVILIRIPRSLTSLQVAEGELGIGQKVPVRE